MGFGHRVYRAEDPRARVLRRTAREIGADALRGRRGAGEGRAGRAAGAQARPRAGDERRVLVGGRARHRRGPAGALHADVHLRARGRLVGAHPRAEARGPADPPDGEVRRPAAAAARRTCSRRQRSSARARRSRSARWSVDAEARERVGRRVQPVAERRRAAASPGVGEHEQLDAAVVLGRAALDEAAVLEPVDDAGDVGVVAAEDRRRARSSATRLAGVAAP